MRHASTLAVFAAIFIALEAVSYTRESATFDEPIHLTDGYFSLALNDHRIDPEHPPLLRMWAALPLLSLPGIVATQEPVNAAAPGEWALDGLFRYSHRFMYIDNDADRLLYRARMMIVIIGLILGGLIYWWAFQWFGWATAALALAIYTVEPNLSAHARLVTTDFGITCFIFGAIFFLWRTIDGWHPISIAGLAVFTGLAVTSKFTGLILGPILAALMVLAIARRQLSVERGLMLAGILAVTSLAAIWAVYGFRYLPSGSPGWQYAVHADPYALERVPTLAQMAAWIDRHRLLPNMYTEGFLLGQARAQSRNAFLAGSYASEGWWYYFPAAVALKTPLTLLVVFAFGLVMCRKRLTTSRAAFVLLPIAIYLGWSLTSRINIGVRHVLPIYPFIILIAAVALQRLVERGRVYLIAAVVGLCVIEAGTAYPHTLAFFNVLAGGPSGGIAYLGDSNLDWGQDLKPLKTWMDENKVEHINLAYFGFADPRYYGIDCTFLPGSPGWLDRALLERPRLPGYVAVSATLLQGVYADNEGQRRYYGRLFAQTPIATIGHSIYVYRVERQW